MTINEKLSQIQVRFKSKKVDLIPSVSITSGQPKTF